MALVFAHAPRADEPCGPPPLRAAAGFEAPELARSSAEALESMVRDVCETAEPILRPDPGCMGTELPGGIAGLPIRVNGRVRGALLVGSRKPTGEALLPALRGVVDSVAIRVDHAFLEDRLRVVEEELGRKRDGEDEKSDEILKLSEALFAQDIELLRSNEKLGTVEKLKNDFIEKMSRELRTPLNSIIESIISVLAGENERLSDQAKTSLRWALDDGTTFLRTLQNILDLWRIKQGALPVDCQEVNFREVVEEAIFSVQDTLGTKAVTIERELVEPLPKIRTDLAKVNQVLFLLLDNAAKFTREGTIKIRAEVVSDTLRCQIDDTGIGICSDDRQFIFDEFFQVDDGGDGHYRGAGLGLTLVRDVLALLDGEIEVQSEIGGGTKVVFTVPVQVIP